MKSVRLAAVLTATLLMIGVAICHAADAERAAVTRSRFR